MYIKSRQNRKGVWINEHEYICLLDSFKFMHSSLDKLAQNLPHDQFMILEDHFWKEPRSSVDQSKQKCSFPYCYIDSSEKLDEVKLPPREKGTNGFQLCEVTVTEAELAWAIEVFELFNCRIIGDYYNLYLTTDVFLLATVVLCFRKVCYKTYGLDCCQYYAALNFSGDAMLEICKPDLELLTEREHLDMIENLIRGGFSSVFAKRLCKANKFVPDYKPKQHSSWWLIPIISTEESRKNSRFLLVLLKCSTRANGQMRMKKKYCSEY